MCFQQVNVFAPFCLIHTYTHQHSARSQSAITDIVGYLFLVVNHVYRVEVGVLLNWSQPLGTGESRGRVRKNELG